MIEWSFAVKPMHAAINPARKCKCIRRGGKNIGQPYTRAEYDEAKHEMHRIAWRSLLGAKIPVHPEGPVVVEITTRGERVRRQGPACGLAQIDADATIKCVLDALSGVAYQDDSQVVRVVSSKTTEGPVGICVRVYREDETNDDNED